jgi:hypothetical protein
MEGLIMATMFSGSAGKTPSLERMRTVALYDRESGHIVHLHSELTYAGGSHPSDAEILAAVLRSAEGRHPDPRRFGVAWTDVPDHAHRPHRIDPATEAFVPVVPGRKKGR